MSFLSLDVRFALRTLKRRPGFAVVAVVILGLGIGASTTIFSAINGVLLRPLPFEGSHRLAFIGTKLSGRHSLGAVSIPQFMDMVGRITTVEGWAATTGSAFDLIGEGEPERIAVSNVSPGFFTTLRVRPHLGRVFTDSEHTRGATRVAIVTYGLWQRRWGGDPDIVGRSFTAFEDRVEGMVSYTIVGVMPPGFRNPPPLEDRYSLLPPAEVWTPLVLDAAAYSGPRTSWAITAVGRLRPGISPDTHAAEVASVGDAIAREHPEVYVRRRYTIGLGSAPLIDVTVGTRRRDLFILQGATVLLLLISCANVAGLLLARAGDRSQEIGLRSALGAGRGRIVRQLLTESLVLGLIGGTLGVGLAFLGVRAFALLGPADFPRLAEVNMDPVVLVFALTLSIVTGFIFGLTPAILGSRSSVADALRSAARGATAGIRTGRFRGGLVAGQLALAFVLLTGSGLLLKSFMKLQNVDPGIDPEGLVMMQVRLPSSYDSRDRRLGFFRELAGRVRGLPGVRSVTHVEDPPMGFSVWSPRVWVESGATEEVHLGSAHAVGADYFRTMGIQILRGRDFTQADALDAPPVVIVNETMARELWPGGEPLGKRVSLEMEPGEPWLTVVGVVNQTRQYSLADQDSWELYLPYTQVPYARHMYMIARTDVDPESLVGSLRRAVWQIDPNLPVPEITTMEARVAATLRLPRFRMFLLGAFALVALLLAAGGVYGTMLYVVERRTQEVGVRMALGAEAQDVLALVLRQGMLPVLVGVALGLAGSFAANRVLRSVLFAVETTDPPTYMAVAGTLALVALLASFLPARRATRVDPMSALRTE